LGVAGTIGQRPAQPVEPPHEPADLTYDRALLSDLTSLRFTEAGHSVLILGAVVINGS